METDTNESLEEAESLLKYRQQDAACRVAGRFVSTVSEDERFWRMVDKVSDPGHWPWTGAVNEGGYGVFQVRLAPGRYKTVLAHRHAWEKLRGPIPKGMTLDHLEHCLRPGCTNPDCQEQVTNAENLRRRWVRQRARQQ